jgi:hypothetical protein
VYLGRPENVERRIPYEHDEECTGGLALQAPLIRPARHSNLVAVEPESPRPVGTTGSGGHRDRIPDPSLQVGNRLEAGVQIGVRRRRARDVTVVCGEQPPAQREFLRVKILAA